MLASSAKVKLNPSSNNGNYFEGPSTTSIDVSDNTHINLVPVGSHGVPLTPLSAGATLINLVLATGPFSYPYSYTKWSPLVGNTDYQKLFSEILWVK